MTHLQPSNAPAAVARLCRDVPLDEVEILATFDEADFQPEEVDPTPPTILVMESEDALLELFRRLLEQRGYRVISASDAREAAEVMRRHDVDLALVSMATPRAREMRDLQKIRRQAGDGCAVVLVCQQLGTRGARRVHDAGADYFITQPYRPETIPNVAALLLDDSPAAMVAVPVTR